MSDIIIAFNSFFARVNALRSKKEKILLANIRANHVAEDIHRNFLSLDEYHQGVLLGHAKNWGYMRIERALDRYFTPIEHCLHYLSLKYHNKCFSGLLENVDPVAPIFKLDDTFSWVKMTKILLVRYPDKINGDPIYGVLDGVHRLSYLRYYGLKSIPIDFVKVTFFE